LAYYHASLNTFWRKQIKRQVFGLENLHRGEFVCECERDGERKREKERESERERERVKERGKVSERERQRE
jgi:hypothetical protein